MTWESITPGKMDLTARATVSTIPSTASDPELSRLGRKLHTRSWIRN